MSFLKDYLHYNSSNECPDSYHIWTAFCVLSSAVSRRVWIHQGYFLVFTNLYVCLVGKQGTRKTTAKDQGYDLLRTALKDEVPMAAESMSKESITQHMSKDEQMRSFRDPSSELPLEYRPFTIFSTELKNFLSINPVNMLDFLTTIYDRGGSCYDVITKNKGSDEIIRPHVVFLSCETPDWIRDRLKQNVISGGFSRRVNFIFELDRKKRIAFPEVLQSQKDAYARMVEHLKYLWSVSGEFTWEADARTFYKKWYDDLVIPKDNPLLEGYAESEHIQVLKLAMLLSVCEYERPIRLVITKPLLELAMEIVNSIKPNMLKLSEGYGSNKLASPSNKLLEMIDLNGGFMPELTLKKLMWNELQGRDFNEVIQHYYDTKQLHRLRDNKTGFNITANEIGMKKFQDKAAGTSSTEGDQKSL